MTTAALFIMLFVCMLLGMPIAFALGLSSITTILFFSSDSLASIALKLFEALSEHYTLLQELLERWSQLEKEQRMNLGHQLLDRMGDNFVPGDPAELKDYLLQISKKKNR